MLPPFLRPGDTVAIVAPASWFPYSELADGLHILRNVWHLNVVEGDSLHAIKGPFAGSDDLRRADLQRFFDDPAIRAVFAARGGYGCYRIADDLNLSGLQANPKWLVGFSDVTVLLSLLYNHGLASLHGLMPRQFGDPDRADALESLRQWLFGESPTHYTVSAHPLNRSGRAQGHLIGGNLTMLSNSIDTPTDLDFNGKILFIEDIDETLFSLDRMMTQLRRAGRLARLAGLVVGQFTDMRGNLSLPFGKDSYEIIADAVVGYDYPVLFDFPAGHVNYNLALPIGQTVELAVQKKTGRINFI
ncbi:S66 peptidase family protein [Spirosoma endophyticum]|uniref:Muramoyltetrapeptide carboxypeptidase n=1 Tax=Spirosoma endophyticum TaxID=662367 RepID=A0A1I1YSM9_9BACT|nr:LD-carboxypeptidase [Spirosoma endophyticum]SFE22604.1 muramoyltetrapeptide carboxypeptidase [Spirosoma endophyticum]